MHRRARPWLLPGLLLCCLVLLVAPARALLLDAIADQHTVANGEAGWYCDASAQQPASLVMQHGEWFRPAHNASRGFTTAACWWRLPLRQRAAAEWWLEIPLPFLDDIQLYLQGADGSLLQRHSGDRQPMSSRDAGASGFLFRLKVPAGDSVLWLRVETSSAMAVLLKLTPASHYPAGPGLRWLLAGGYLGIIITALALSVLHVLLIRQRLYLLYMLYLICQLMLAAVLTGVAAEFLFPNWPQVPDRLAGYSFGLLVLLGLALFWYLLHVRRHFPWLRYVFFSCAGSALATALAALQGNAYLHVAPMLLLMLLPTLLLVLLPALRCLRGGEEDRLFAVAYLGFALFLLSSTASLLGLIALDESTLKLAQTANMVHMLVLQTSMIMRTRRSEREAAIARQQADQQQRLAEEQEGFLATITQAVRTPLAAIDSANRGLRSGDLEPARAREQRYERIAEAVHRMDMLMRLSPSTDAPGDEASDQLIELVSFSHSVLEELPAEWRRRIRLGSGSPHALVRGRAALLQFAIVNLLDNACKYSPVGSPVELDIRSWPSLGLVYLTVSDHGPGVPLEDRFRIFEKYYRAGDRAGKPGLGLGLFIARSQIERIGGQLHYRERPHGACFEICLPLQSEA